MTSLESLWFIRRPFMTTNKSSRKLRSMLPEKDVKMAQANDTTEVTAPGVEAPAVEASGVETAPVVERPIPPTAEQIANQPEEKLNTRALGRQAWIAAGKPKMADFELVYGTRKLSWVRIIAEAIKPAPEDFQAALAAIKDAKQDEKQTS